MHSSHRKSHFSACSRSEAPKTASWLTAPSGFAENRFISTFFFRRRLPRSLSFLLSHGCTFLPAFTPRQSFFIESLTVWRDLGCGVNQVVGTRGRVFFRGAISRCAGKVAVAPPWSWQVPSKLTFTTLVKDLQRHCLLSEGDLVFMPRNSPTLC